MCISRPVFGSGMYVCRDAGEVLEITAQVLGDSIETLACSDEDADVTSFNRSGFDALIDGDIIMCGTWKTADGDTLFVQPAGDHSLEVMDLFSIREGRGDNADFTITENDGVLTMTFRSPGDFWERNGYDPDNVEAMSTIFANLLEVGGYMETGEYTMVWYNQMLNFNPQEAVYIGRGVELDGERRVSIHNGLWPLYPSEALSSLFDTGQYQIVLKNYVRSAGSGAAGNYHQFGYCYGRPFTTLGNSQTSDPYEDWLKDEGLSDHYVTHNFRMYKYAGVWRHDKQTADEPNFLISSIHTWYMR